MKLFLLTRDDYDYDQYTGFVVRALDRRGARLIANEAAQKTDGDVWLKAKCVEIKVDGVAGIVLADFHAG